jgi:succinoglycan biosynthesis transport protein ExoP
MSSTDLPALVAAPTPEPQWLRAAALTPRDFVAPGLSFAQMVTILRAYWRLSLLIAAAVIAAVGLACALWPRTYEATATLMVKFEVNDPLTSREFPVGLLASYLSTQVELARGSDVLLPVINRLGLVNDSDYAAGYDGDPEGLRNWIELQLRKQLTIEPGLFGSQLIYVRYSDSRPAQAAQVANTVAAVYADQQRVRLRGPANDRAKRYTVYLAGLQDKVSAAQAQVARYRKDSSLIDSDARNNVDLQLLSTLEQRLLEAQNARRVAAARAAGDQSVGTEVLGSTMVQSLKAQSAAQQSRFAELRATMGPNHPQILELQSQISATQRALAMELKAYAGNASAELASARQLESSLKSAVEEQRASVINVRQLQGDGAKFQLELESAQSVYKRALDGYDEIMFAATGGYTNVSFVSRATPPARASKPKVKVVMLMACVVGVLLGFGLPLAWELLFRRVRCRDDIERDLGMPVLVELGPLIGLTPRFQPT